MNVVFLDQGFSTSAVGVGARTHGLAAGLARAGHQVTIVTSDRNLSSLLSDESRLVHCFDVQGVAVRVINAGLTRSNSFAGRLWSHLLFALVSLWQLLLMNRPDVVYAVSPPLSVALPALLARWLRHLPFIFEVRDLVPDVLVGLGSIRSSLLIRMLSWLEHITYAGATRIVTLAEGVARHIAADPSWADKVKSVPNYCDIELFRQGDRARIRAENGWTEKFVCLYAGPMSRENGLEAMIRIADVLREDEQFVFWLVGQGDDRAKLEQNIRDRGLTNVVIWDQPSRQDMPDILAAADLCLMTIGPYRILEQSHGGQVFDYWAAGQPVVLNYGGWQRELLEKHQAGFGTDMGHYEQFYQRICDLCDHPQQRAEMGRHARELAENKFDFERVFAAFQEVLHEAVGS